MWYVQPKDELYHHGIKGQKWGVRRYQEPDGSLTEKGKLRYSYDIKSAKAGYKGSKKQLRAAKRSRYETKEEKKNVVIDAKHNKAREKSKIVIERAKKSLDNKKFKIKPGKARDVNFQFYKELGLPDDKARIAAKALETTVTKYMQQVYYYSSM